MQSKEDIIEDLLNQIPCDVEVEVELPSEGRAYNLDESESLITLRPMTFEDEKSVLSSPNEDPVNTILQRCLKGIKVMDLLPMDKLYLIMKLREISYGDEYNCLIICPKCKAENPTKVLLSQLTVNPVPDDFSDKVTVTLPKLGKEVVLRYPRVRDDKYGKAEAWVDNLWRYVVSLDNHTDKSIIAAVVDKLPLVDIKTIIGALSVEYGIENKVVLECNSCGGASVVDLPIGANFFAVS
jgi:hypothetical protein